MPERTHRIGIVGFAGAEALDIVGPFDTFGAANSLVGGRPAPYELLVVASREGAFPTASGLSLVATQTLARCPALDTVIVPGGPAIRTDAAIRGRIAAWLKERAPKIRRVASVCTGMYALAEAGLLDGRKVTTHWAFAREAAALWPKIDLDPNAIYTKSGRYYTSAGITAGIDLSLAMIEEDLGNRLALNVARHLVVYVKRPGGQLQYSEPLRLQETGGAAFADTVSWMLENLSADLSVETLAERAHLSERHYARKFKAAFRATPAEFVEALRLDHARWLLANERSSIDELARAVGYASDDAFRRAFTRRFGTVPSDYRRRLLGR